MSIGRRPAPVIAVAALLLASGSAAAELLPGVGIAVTASAKSLFQ
jgi:hypothetical protein